MTYKTEMQSILDKIINVSVQDYYNPYDHFKWPDKLEEDVMWMPLELMSIYNTHYLDDMSHEEIIKLSKWESINFYSMNVHNIRELLISVMERVHMPGFEEQSEYFHHFIGEENEHMYFFAKFCLNYGGKIYHMKKIRFESEYDKEIENFIVFTQILLFEEIVDYYNLKMSKDQNLHPIIREINKIHHQDESRHIAFGRMLVKYLWKKIKEKYSGSDISELQNYLNNYIISGFQDFYNPTVYKDAGLSNHFEMRTNLMTMSSRQEVHKQVSKKVIDFMLKNEILNKEVF
ncbi:AurF domain containing protein [Bacillus cereus]|nr:AurF domain containing protein [Bacillus cereus]